MQKAGGRLNSIRTKILAALILLTLAMTLYTALASYKLAMRRVENIGVRLSAQYTAAAGRTLEDAAVTLHALSNDVVWSGALRRISTMEPDERADTASLDELETAVFWATSNHSRGPVWFDNVTVALENGFVRQPRESVAPQISDGADWKAWLEDIGAGPIEEGYVSPFWIGARRGGMDAEHLLYVRYIYDTVNMRKLGAAVFEIQARKLKTLYDAYVTGGFVIGESGAVLLEGRNSPQDAGDARRLWNALKKHNSSVNNVRYLDENGAEQLAAFYPVTGVKGYLVVPFQLSGTVREEEIAEFMRSMALMGGIGLAGAVLLALLLSKGLYSSTAKLLSFVKRVEDSGGDVRFEPASRDEIAVLGGKINEMLDQIQTVNRQREEKLVENQVMELQLMQQQINPHLLYNTLDSVLWVMKQNRTEDAETLLYSLSEFFKLSLSRGRDMIPLREEVDLIRHYLRIQQLAYQKDIEFVCDVAEELEEYPIAKLSLQPIVENSVLHGFAGYSEEGVIRLRARAEGDAVLIALEDDGLGMLEDEVENINAILRQSARPAGFTHFGLYNINRRIVQAYGPEYGLTVSSEFNVFTRVELRLPRMPGKDEENRDVL